MICLKNDLSSSLFCLQLKVSKNNFQIESLKVSLKRVFFVVWDETREISSSFDAGREEVILVMQVLHNGNVRK